MKELIFALTLLLASNCNSQQKNCSDFKVGHFTYADKDYADLITVRNDSLQTDSYPKIGLETISRINWLSDCKYEMDVISVNDPKMESLIGVEYIIEIVDINANKIICRTESDGIVVEKEMIKTTTE